VERHDTSLQWSREVVPIERMGDRRPRGSSRDPASIPEARGMGRSASRAAMGREGIQGITQG
jgi:hypothetical protein